MLRIEGGEVRSNVDDREMLVNFLGGVRVVSVMGIEQVFRIGTGSHEFPLKVDDLGCQSLHSSLDGFFLSLVIRRSIPWGRFGLVVSGPGPWPALLLDLDSFGDDVADDVPLVFVSVVLDVTGDID